jgi:hypothetical protein
LSLSTPESVQKLQTALHDKAKEAPSFRFYALYDKVYRKDVLAFAYECCKANGHPAADAHCASPIRRNRSSYRGSGRMGSQVGSILMKFRPKRAS